ncbi:MAG TPA: hypothetical protein VJU83_02705, partial [Burkholderiales bacterium]|nr:hypothetical protein [Burkholderiales bacterium]
NMADGDGGDDTLRFDLSGATGDLNINLNAYSNWDGSVQFWADAQDYSNGNLPAHVNAYGFEHFEVTGGQGNDTINGSIASETLNGGEGDDHLYGGMGQDVLTGGTGHDCFTYSQLSEGGADEWITDFMLGMNGDLLDLGGFYSNHPGFVVDAQHVSFSHIDSNNDGSTDYTQVGVDVDGGGDNFLTLVNLQGVEMTLGNWENLLA